MQEAYLNGENPDDPVTLSRNRTRERAEAERKAADEAREMHMLNEQIRAEAKTSELNKLLKGMSEEKRVDLRLAIYLKYLDRAASGMSYGNMRQMHLDEMVLDAARYAITGSV